MSTSTIGSTSLGLPLNVHEFGIHGQRLLILGGVHGDEIEGVALARALEQCLRTNFPFRMQVKLWCEVNPEGVLLKSRGNSRGVDLNRNLPTKDWSATIANPRYNPGPFPNSEKENQSLCRLIDNWQPEFILSLHSWKPLINVNGNCQKQAQILHTMTGYPIEGDIGYPTPGCLGTYTGKERSIPTITYEIERGLPIDQVLRLHMPAMIEFLKSLEK